MNWVLKFNIGILIFCGLKKIIVSEDFGLWMVYKERDILCRGVV